jgi:hypothetical protein
MMITGVLLVAVALPLACAPLPPPAEYRYRCTGLRLLYVQSGTYYLLPVRWSAPPDPTYVIDASDQVRFELSGG